MFTVSYLIDGHKLNQRDVDRLSVYVEVCRKEYSAIVEFLVYGKNLKPLVSHSRSIQIIDEATKLEALYVALASASSIWTVITHLENVLSDTSCSIARLMAGQNDGHVILPLKHLGRQRRISSVISNNVPYVAISKAFFIETLDGKDFSLKRIIRLANQIGYLRLTYSPEISHAQSVIRGIIAIRYKNPDKAPTGLNDPKLPGLNKVAIKYSNKIPVFIICRDRLKPLLELVRWLEDEDMKNIYFVNNASTYPPLLKYFDLSPYHVINLNLINDGHTSPWSQGIISVFAKGQPYIVSDPDILPADTANGAIEYFISLLNKYQDVVKVGFGLKIDDLPDYYEPKQDVIKWEKKFWENPAESDVYRADIDTTLAVYRPGAPYALGPALRTGGRFVARHEAWYTDSNNVGKELAYYRNHADKSVGTWGINKNDTSKTYGGSAASNNYGDERGLH